MYLTDVDEDSGPHTFFPRTHDPLHVAALRDRWPGGRREFHVWFFHQLRKTDNETRARLEGSPTLLTGPAGTRLMVNTRGIHKGLAPVARDRLVCQVVYGISPFMQPPRRQVALFPATLGTGLSSPPVAAPAGAARGLCEPLVCEPVMSPTATNPLAQAQPEPSTFVIGRRQGPIEQPLAFLIVDAIFADPGTRTAIKARLPDRLNGVDSHRTLIAAIGDALRDLGRDPAALRLNPSHLLKELAGYRTQLTANSDTYNRASKPNPDGVFWPNRRRNPSDDLFDTLPMVANRALVNQRTPVGSAGSCFAIEIAEELQRRGFHYVRTEDESRKVAEGVIMTGYDPARVNARFCANWGLLFNTPSFRQLAERAFGERATPRLLVPLDRGPSQPRVYSDPFREGVAFVSPEAYAADYERHLAACREALQACRVFVLTMGLNECWEYVPDGSVLSRNPRGGALLPFIRPRVLTVDENVANVRRFVEIIRAHNPDFAVILSVSPVPLIATARAREHHVISANAHSKAVLRTATETLVDNPARCPLLPQFRTGDDLHPGRLGRGRASCLGPRGRPGDGLVRSHVRRTRTARTARRRRQPSDSAATGVSFMTAGEREFTLELTPDDLGMINVLLAKHPEQLLHIPHVRALLSAARLKRLREEDVRTLEATGPGVIENALAHNLSNLSDTASLDRPTRLIGPLRSIKHILKNQKAMRVLTVGPRTEAELFTLMALGFEPRNIRALDLISYSALVDLGDMHDMLYPEASFDVVILSGVLGYSRDNPQVVREILRVAAPGAYVAIGCYYSPWSNEELNRSKTIKMDGTRFESADDILALFDGVPREVLFRHDIHPSMADTVGTVMVIFRLADG